VLFIFALLSAVPGSMPVVLCLSSGLAILPT